MNMAGSRNAFASSQAPRSSVLTEQDHNARPPKRPRLAEDAVASIQTQCTQADTSLEVDVMILDYVTYQTIQACLASRNVDDGKDASGSLSSALAISNSFLAIFKARHQTYKPDPELRFRIMLLKLATLFTQRLTSNPSTPAQSALKDSRTANKERTRSWTETAGHVPSSDINFTDYHNAFPLPLDMLERNRAHVLHELGVPAEDEDYEDAFYGTSSCVSLLDLLPIFMQVSAARNAMSGSNLTERWMRLACEFMLQACLEQYLVFGEQDAHVIDEVFAWGYLNAEHDAMDVDEEGSANNDINIEINPMFEDEVYAIQVEAWDDMKLKYLKQAFPHPARDTADRESLLGSDTRNAHSSNVILHLEALAAEHPIASFESSLLKFLEAMSNSIPNPVLIQLENGKLDGMTEQQTQEFLEECGVGTANFFAPPVGFKAPRD